MDVCKKILKSGEIKNFELNNKIYEIVLQEFLETINKDFIFQDCSTAGDKVRGLKDQYVYQSEHIDIFFEILAKHNYNMRQEIKDAIFCLGHLEDPNKNMMLIIKLIGSPIIEDITFNGKNEFTIYSEQYGEFVFELASYYFRKNKQMTSYMKNNRLPNECHNHTYFMSNAFDDFYAITSLCQYYFKNDYFHSFTYDKDRNAIIDLCSNSIIDKKKYYDLFQPKDVSIIKNWDVAMELALTNLKTEQGNRCNLLKIALYKLYLESIGYQGSLYDAPSTVKIKSYL